MDISDDALSTLIIPGTVLYLHKTFNNSDDPHYHIVLNIPLGPYADIVTVNATTNITGRKRHISLSGLSLSTLIESNACPDTPFLTENSAFDCNAITTFTKAQLLEKYHCGEWILAKGSNVSEEFLKKLITATKNGASAEYLRDLL